MKKAQTLYQHYIGHSHFCLHFSWIHPLHHSCTHPLYRNHYAAIAVAYIPSPQPPHHHHSHTHPLHHNHRTTIAAATTAPPSQPHTPSPPQSPHHHRSHTYPLHSYHATIAATHTLSTTATSPPLYTIQKYVSTYNAAYYHYCCMWFVHYSHINPNLISYTLNHTVTYTTHLSSLVKIAQSLRTGEVSPNGEDSPVLRGW